MHYMVNLQILYSTYKGIFVYFTKKRKEENKNTSRFGKNAHGISRAVGWKVFVAK